MKTSTYIIYTCSIQYAFISVYTASKTSASRALNYWVAQLFKAELFIPPEMAKKTNAAGIHFLAAYSRLARLSMEQHELRFTLLPKVHMYWHVIFNMVDQASFCGEVENPMAQSCSVDEDFIGRFCALTRAVSPRKRLQRAIERYLTHVALLWKIYSFRARMWFGVRN